MEHFQGVRGYIRPVEAVFCDDFAVVGNWMNSAHPQVNVIVFTQAKRDVEPPGLEQVPAIIHHGPVHADLIAPQKSKVGVRSDIPADRATRYAAASVDMVKTAIDKSGLWIGKKTPQTGFDRPLAKPVVSIEKNDLVTARGC